MLYCIILTPLLGITAKRPIQIRTVWIMLLSADTNSQLKTVNSFYAVYCNIILTTLLGIAAKRPIQIIRLVLHSVQKKSESPHKILALSLFWSICKSIYCTLGFGLYKQYTYTITVHLIQAWLYAVMFSSSKLSFLLLNVWCYSRYTFYWI